MKVYQIDIPLPVANVLAKFCFSEDVNECSAKRDQCHPHANCTNSKGSYLCTCKSGFKGDGSSCEGLC